MVCDLRVETAFQKKCIQIDTYLSALLGGVAKGDHSRGYDRTVVCWC